MKENLAIIILVFTIIVIVRATVVEISTGTTTETEMVVTKKCYKQIDDSYKCKILEIK